MAIVYKSIITEKNEKKFYTCNLLHQKQVFATKLGENYRERKGDNVVASQHKIIVFKAKIFIELFCKFLEKSLHAIRVDW